MTSCGCTEFLVIPYLVRHTPTITAIRWGIQRLRHKTAPFCIVKLTNSTFIAT